MGGRTGSGACLDEQDVLELGGQAGPDYSRTCSRIIAGNDQIPMANDQSRMVYPGSPYTARRGPSRGDQAIRLGWVPPTIMVIGNWSLVI